MKRSWLIVALSFLAVSSAVAAPTLTLGSISGPAGTTVTMPITFDPTTASVAGMQFNLTVPAGLSTGTITAGAILNTAGKSITANLVGNTWTFIIFGLNQTTISSGTLLTAQFVIAPGTSLGSLSIPVSNLVYSDPNGNTIPNGTTTNGTVTVAPQPPVITSSGTATGTTGVAFSYQIAATNSPTSFNATGLPTGLTINTGTGLISGTPTAVGVSNVSLSATNAGGTGTLTLTLTVNPPAPVITSSGTATGTTGVAFNYQITATNSPTSFNATGLPSGLSINTGTGLISGTPSVVGVSSVSLSATNAGGTGTLTLTLTVNPPAPVITSTGTATGTTGVAFSYQISATNNPTSFNATGLPAGLAINTGTGLISGTPSAVGVSTVSLSASNAGGTGTKTLILTVNPPVPVITSTGTATGTTGVAFSYQIAATNSPTSFNATGLPTGLTINTGTGLISGTPSVVGVSTVSLSATNAGGTGTKTLILTINPPAPVITSTNTIVGITGTAFTYQITATNSPTSFNATGLPAGLSINTGTGLISGTPTAAGTSSVSLSATNSGGSGTQTLALTVYTACDINRDTITNVNDVQLEVNMAIGIQSCTADINHDGVCNVLDIQRVVNAALGGQCVTP